MAPRPPNYNQARGDRNRAKEQKKQERLRRREEDALRRKANRPQEPGESPGLSEDSPSSHPLPAATE
jgi:hypothetical protein